MAAFIPGSELGLMIALTESRSAPGHICASAHQRTTVFAGRIAVNQFIRDRLGKVGVAK
jgi:hypothetical protein